MKNKIINLFIAIVIAFNAYTIDFPNKNGWQHHNKSKTKSTSNSAIPDNKPNNFRYDDAAARSNVEVFSRVGPIERNPNHKLVYSSGPQTSSHQNASKTNSNSAQPPTVNPANSQNVSPEKESKSEVKTNPEYRSVAHKADLEAAYSTNSAMGSSNQSSSVSAVVNFSASADGSTTKNSSINAGTAAESKTNLDRRSVAHKSDLEIAYSTNPQMGSSNQNSSVSAVINISASNDGSNRKSSSENRPSTSNINILSGSVPADCNANLNLVYSSVPQTNSSTQNAPSTTSVPNSVSPGTSTNNQNSFDKTVLAGIYVTDSQERSTANKSEIIGNHQPSSQKDSSNQNEATAKLVLSSDMSDNSSNRNSSADATTQKDKIDSDSKSVIHVDGTKIVLGASQNNLSNQNKSIIQSAVILARPEGSLNNQHSSASAIATTEMKVNAEENHIDIEKTELLVTQDGNELAKIKEKDSQPTEELFQSKSSALGYSSLSYLELYHKVMENRYKDTHELLKEGYFLDDDIRNVAQCNYSPEIAFTIIYEGMPLVQKVLPYVAYALGGCAVVAADSWSNIRNKNNSNTFEQRLRNYENGPAQELPPLSGSVTTKVEDDWRSFGGYNDRVYSPKEISEMRATGIISPILTLDENGILCPDLVNGKRVDPDFNFFDKPVVGDKNQNEKEQKSLTEKKSTADELEKNEQKSTSNNQKAENEKKQTSVVSGSSEKNEENAVDPNSHRAQKTTINEKNVPAPSFRGGKDLFEVNHRHMPQENRKIKPEFETKHRQKSQEHDKNLQTKNAKKEAKNKDGAKKAAGVAQPMPPDPNDDKNKFNYQNNNFESKIYQDKIQKSIEHVAKENKMILSLRIRSTN